MISTYLNITYLNIWISALLCAAVAFGCNRSQPERTSDSLARVGNHYLTLREAKEDIPEFIYREDSVSALNRYRKNWIQKQILLQEVQRLGLAHKAKVREKLKRAREDVLVESLKNYVIGSRKDEEKISDEEARAYYQANKNQFLLEEDYVQFRHLSTRTSREARAAKQELLQGTSWPEVARRYAIDPEKAINESEQFWPVSTAVNNIDIMNRYLHIIGIEEVSPIQRVRGEYHFVQLIQKRAKGEHPDLKWLIGQIKDWVALNKDRRNFSSYVKNLYLKANSNNEVETFNVLPTKSNQKSNLSDTLEGNPNNE